MERTWHRPDILPGWVGGWNLPLVVQSQPVVQQVPAPYPVPYYVPVPYRRAEVPRPEPVPYDPSKASIVMIGGGSDGGAGVLRWHAAGRDSLQVTWLGALRPVREARVVVTDSLHVELVSRPVTMGNPVVLRTPRGNTTIAAYVGVVVTHTDGSRMTTLVPIGSR